MTNNNDQQTRPDIINHSYEDDILKGRWSEFKGGIRKLWGKITDEELDDTKGELNSVAGLIHKKYGESKETINHKLGSVFENLDENPIDAANRNARERQL